MLPVPNALADQADEIAAWRRDLHAHPEIGLDCARTAGIVAARLREWGADAVHEGLARTGVVGVVHGRAPGPTVILRADMDALPMTEATGAAWSSAVPGAMHACGHDGHTAMLLAAARRLIETRAFAGSVLLMFQPAEESDGGARIMLEDGLLGLAPSPVAAAFALHSLPGLEVGAFLTRPGAIMAACDQFTVRVTGQGGHAAYPQETRDPILPLAAIVQAVQGIAARDRDPLRGCVLAVTQVHAGTTDNVTPQDGWLMGTLRTFDRATRATVLRRLREAAEGIAAAHGVGAAVEVEQGYPPCVNDPATTALAVGCARAVGTRVVDDAPPEMGAEDFAFVAERVPSAYLFVGNGDGAGLHSPAYDFDDAAAPYGAALLVACAEAALRGD